MAKNTLSDLNTHLFAQLERLNEEGLTQEQLDKEVERSKAINGIAKNIIDNAKTALEGVQVGYEQIPHGNVPPQFNVKRIE